MEIVIHGGFLLIHPSIFLDIEQKFKLNNLY